MRRFPRIFLALGIILSSLSASALSARAADCQYVLGFAALHNLIPAIVGDCLENEHHNPENGDGLQATTNGLLVWRKADNFTAFTDGHRTWVNGPFGLQTRLNTERFAWEPLAIEALRNATYKVEASPTGTVTLVDGSARVPIESGGATELVVSPLDQIAFGDLDGDGSPDAVVILAVNPGGSGTFIHLAAVQNQNGTPVNVATHLLGDRVRVNSVAIDSGVITVDLVTHGSNDPLCCPTEPAVQRFRLQDGHFVEVR